MKIALFHNLPPGGAKRALYEHARHLRRRGHTIDAYVPATAAEGFLPLEPLCRKVHTYDVSPAGAGAAERVLCGLLGGLPGRYGGLLAGDYRQIAVMHRELTALERTYDRIARDLNARGYDLIYVHHCRATMSPRLLRLAEAPTVYYCQDTLRSVCEWRPDEKPDYDRKKNHFYVRKRRGDTFTLPALHFQERIEREYVANTRAADVVLANSHYSREAILRTTGVNAQVCYLGVDGDFWTPDTAVGRDNVVLSVGALVPSKRHDFILEAVAALPEARRPSMRIIGYEMEVEPGADAPGPSARRLLCLAEQKGVRLRIDREVDDAALRDAYRRAGVVAFAPYLEPFGFVPLEAMACGAPVVGVREGGLRETISDGITGLLTGRDAEEFGAALDRVLTDRALAAAIGENGRQTATERWSWPRSVDDLERCFRKAICARGGGQPLCA